MSNEKEIIVRWRTSTPDFVHDCMRAKEGVIPEPSNQQMEAMVEFDKLVIAKTKAFYNVPLNEIEKAYAAKIGLSIMSGQGPGKDTFTSWLIWKFLACFSYPKVICTAPTAHQLRSVLWSELVKWITYSPIKDWFEVQSDKIFYKEAGGERWFALARTANPKDTPDEQAETLSGQHEDYMLIVADEACHDDKTEVLTDSGWKFFKNLDHWDLILTMNPKTHIAEYQKPTAHIRYPWKDNLYSVSRRGINFRITPQHQLWGHTQSKKYIKLPINQFRSDPFYIPRTIKWKTVENKKIKDNKIRLYAWFIAEGSFKFYPKTRKPNSISIAQKSEATRKEIFAIADSLGLAPKLYSRAVNIHNVKLATEMLECGDGFKNKHLPLWIKNLSVRQLNIFLDAFIKGDGYSRPDRDILYTSSSRLADDLQEIILKTGCNSTVSIRKIKGQKKWIVDHWGTSTCDAYVISRTKNHCEAKLRIRDIKQVPYNGFVYCVTVPNGIILTRRSGHAMWSGNSGIADPVFKPLEGTLTGKLNLALCIFNPTKAKGYAIRTQREDRKFWVTLRWNCEESNRVDQSHIAFMRSKYGRDSNTYRIRVLGLPPKMDEFTLFDPEWIEAATRREDDEPYLLPLDDDEEFMIIDVGAGSDESVATRRRGPLIIDLMSKTTSESRELANWLMGLIKRYEPSMVFIDPLGVGWGITGILEQYCPQTRIVSVNVTEVPTDPTRFHRMRDELWWRLREQFEKRQISIPNDILLIDELLAMKLDQKSYEQKGIIKIESKRDMIKRGVESPNRGDTLAMSTYYDLESLRMMRQTESIKNWSKRRATSWRTA